MNNEMQLARITNYKILSAQNKFSDSQFKFSFCLNTVLEFLFWDKYLLDNSTIFVQMYVKIGVELSKIY